MPTSKKRGSNVLTGDLLVSADLVSVTQLARAMPISQKTGVPIGRVLVETRVLPEHVVRATVLAQTLLRDNLLHMDLAVKALKIVQVRNVSLEEALAGLGWHSEYYERVNKLGDIMVEAGCITEAQLSAGFEVCFASGLPLSRVLVLRQVVPEAVAYAAVTAQVLMRERQLTHSQAVEFIRAAFGRRISYLRGRSAGDLAADTGKVRLGELLVAAGFVSEIDLLSAVELSMLQDMPIGQVLVNANAITQGLLNAALDVQRKINMQGMSGTEAVQLLRMRAEILNRESQIHLQQQQKPPSAEEMDLPELLRAVGMSQEQDLPKVIRELLLQKEHLAFKIVSQHEEIKTALARELHDTIIADLMMLKRYLAGDRKMSAEEIVEIVDHVIRQLRDICFDFAPRQLQDLGLAASLKDLLERMEHRTGIRCRFICDFEVPRWPEQVNLHIFRIMQESLNNIEKYAGANEISIEISRPPKGRTSIIVTDNGKGFDPGETGGPTIAGGLGMSSLHERAELISVYIPARLSIDSKPGLGSRVVLELSA